MSGPAPACAQMLWRISRCTKKLFMPPDWPASRGELFDKSKRFVKLDAGSMQLKVGQASRLPSQPWGIGLNKRIRISSRIRDVPKRYELIARTAVRAWQARRLPYVGLYRSG